LEELNEGCEQSVRRFQRMSSWKGGKRRKGHHDICVRKAGAKGKRSRVACHKNDNGGWY
jgi:hypothetical protein